jgi:hypothetical protein
VLEDAAAGLLGRAVVGLVLGEKDGLDRHAAARAGLALALVDLERLRRLVWKLISDCLLVVLDCVAEHMQSEVETGDLVVIQLGSLLEGRESRLPENLVDPGTPNPGDGPLLAQQWVKASRLADQRREFLQRRRGPRFRTEGRDHLVLCHGIHRQQLRPRPLFRPELPQPQLSVVPQPDQDAGGPVSRRRPSVERSKPPGGHQMEQQRQIPKLDHNHLPDPSNSRDLSTHQLLQWGVKSLHNVHSRRNRRFHASSSQHGVQPPHRDLDLGQFGHAERVDSTSVHSTGSRQAPGQRT